MGLSQPLYKIWKKKKGLIMTDKINLEAHKVEEVLMA